MKNKFIADGRWRFLRAKKIAASESIEKKYAAELAGAKPAEKIQIRERMVEEYRRLLKNEGHKPSPAALW
jgi:hypothetical protein